MTTRALEKLLELASSPVGSGPALLPVRPNNANGRLVGEWLQMLDRRNGFFCFESALHVFPSRSGAGVMGLSEWNAADGWRQEYKNLDRGGLFVAEDIFGNQFSILGDLIYTFDAETAEVKHFARSIDEWADKVVTDFNAVTGFPVAHQWQSAHGALPAGQRLVPKTPFVLGGEFKIDNLYACEASAGMRARGNLAVQIAGVPDGAAINYKVVG
jgi:hypothetical protein